MQTIKLHEATKEFGISNKLAMFFLERKNIPVKSHSSVISMDQLELLREFSNNQGKFSDILKEFDRRQKEKKQRNRKAKVEKIEVEPKIEKEKKKEPITIAVTKEPEAKARRPEIEYKKPEYKVREPEVEVRKEEFKYKPPKPPKVEERIEKDRRPKPRPRPFERAKEREREIGKRERFEAPKKEERVVDKIEKPGKEIKAVDFDRERMRKEKERFKPRPNRKERIKFKQKFKKEKPKIKAEEGKPTPKAEKGGKTERIRIPMPEPAAAKKEIPKPKEKVYDLPELIQTSNFINIKELAEKLNLKLKDIEEKMRSLKNKEYLTNQILDIEEIEDICDAFNVPVDIVSYEEEIFSTHVEKYKAVLSSRAPVVTVMGHVDHGKTTLLDTLRHTQVADREAGGITQKIGAYKLTYEGKDIVFIDTPGHEAFTNIRARGAKVTDVVVLVVAVNDGVQPQTLEAINHARAADVPLVVAINKIDIEGADSNKVKQQLSQHDVVVEDWGGEVVCVEISAKQNKNLDSLLEMLNLVSEMLELKAYKKIPARGTIIESRLDPQLGPMGTLLIQHGQLKIGDFFICGDSVGKVKSMFDHQGEVIKEAEVPLPLEIMGFEEVPEAGQLFQVTDDIEKARKVVEMRKLQDKDARKEDTFAEKKLSLQNLFEKLEEGKTREFPIIIKTDNFSSGEVLEKILLKQKQDQLKITIIHRGVGNITESDILLASTSGAMIIAFNVKAPQKLMPLVKREQVEIKLYNVIYHLIEDIEKAIKGEITPEYIESLIGKVEVLQTFKISKIGIIAGCLVKEGKVTNKSKVKVLRNNDFVFEGAVETLRRVKNDVAEVNAGTECGIKIKNFNAIKIGDLLEIYETREKE
ncbi:MAG: translation initiation factor IF-2 [Candidatus Aminicenantes bacterium]|nr:translation initiation factor IF-2 [Candidatus Aminicenantes bacterium]NIM77383.1 translation initiation factor IF-2 [Candidatus Aminicenantes bacterium]NIN16680.1 translation initiation factor IF-2 [Candidatus Aminicenantes bacterium]NIN40536.1 translation initiation factor IF-2 [Candidatus Aminicenantes bacterium]NIN83356.1 translation initiation factor IF-2 [Candidatus Aminicenantes bacterium]